MKLFDNDDNIISNNDELSHILSIALQTHKDKFPLYIEKITVDNVFVHVDIDDTETAKMMLAALKVEIILKH